jgi:peptidoglycan/xylan/chitin deacetylase (PgdA/CDA1 family)
VTHRASLRQLIAGAIALPLSLLPFLAYLTLTPEGRLVRDRALVALFPPALPTLDAAERAAALRDAPRYHDAVMALAYHGIGSASDGEGGFVVSPARFGEHLATLQAAGMKTVTASDVADAMTKGETLPPNAVMISFDDGRNDAMLFADPLLRRAGMRATMFVITGAASRPGIYYASWDRLEAAARSGRWDIQSHTAELHREQDVDDGPALPALTSLAPNESRAQFRARIRRDLKAASDAIATHVGHRPTAFAYPFGAYGADRTNDPAIEGIVREEVARVHSIAFHQDEQQAVPLVRPTENLTGLRRLEVGNWTGTELLAQITRASAHTDLPVAEGNAPESPPTPAGVPPEVSELAAPPEDGAVGGVRQDALNELLERTVDPVATVPVPPMTLPPSATVPVPPPTVAVPPATSPPTLPPTPTTPTLPPPPTTPTTQVGPVPTSPPLTLAPPANCGGQGHGQRCKK